MGFGAAAVDIIAYRRAGLVDKHGAAAAHIGLVAAAEDVAAHGDMLRLRCRVL